jgi:GNAT superfamily N-acetyltransferase
MANAEITPVGLGELNLIVDLFRQVFRPGRERLFFERRFRGRYNPLLLLAQVDRSPAGFAIGYELKPGTFYCWLVGVLSQYRRAGIAAQLMEAMTAWARDNGYHIIRFECYNSQRPMLHLAIRQGYDIVGLRLDPDTGTNLIIMENDLGETASDDDATDDI